MGTIKYNLDKIKNPRKKRLAQEHMGLDKICKNMNHISYELGARKFPPDTYLVHYNVLSIQGIDKNQNPIYGNKHTVEIKIPLNYPMEAVQCYMKTPIWHPNIKSKGVHKGRICSNTKRFGKNYNIGLLVQRIGEILAYQNYHAINTPPFPEDETVARWVREYAEPKGFINPEKGLIPPKS